MLHWLKHYRRALLPGDISAGLVVAMMMIPQGMAYAMVAGLPPVVGIYASIEGIGSVGVDFSQHSSAE